MNRGVANRPSLISTVPETSCDHAPRFRNGVARPLSHNCECGISHSEAEHADPASLIAGTRVLAEVMLRLADGRIPESPANGHFASACAFSLLHRHTA